MTRRILVITNPVAGGGKGEHLARRLCEAFTRRGCAVELCLTERQRTGRELAREARHLELDALVVVGGDGSVNDVLAGLDGARVPLAVLPAGTANVWAREAGLSADPEQLAETVLTGRKIEVTLGRVNGELFFLFVGAGLDARIVARVERVRRRAGGRGGMAPWLLPALSVYLGRPLADLVVQVDGRSLDGIGQVLVTRVRSYAGFLRMPKGMRIEDGRLHVLAFSRRSKLSYLGMALGAATGRLRAGRDLIHVVTDGPVRIESAVSEPFQRDGDHAGETPVEISLDSRRACFLLPPL